MNTNPIITYALIGVAVIVSLQSFSNKSLFYKLSFSPYEAKQRGKWYKTITHGFVHADYMHLLFNMYVLYMFGQTVEIGAGEGVNGFVKHFGNKGHYLYLLLYFGGLLFATLPAFYKHSDNPSYVSIGASGAVSAVVFSFIILNPTIELFLLFLPIPIPGVVFGLLYLGLEAYMDRRGGSKIAHDAHFWGAIFGIIFTILIDLTLLKTFVEQVKELIGV